MTPATPGVPSPQPPTASVRIDVATRRQRVGVGERREHERAGVLALDRGEVLVEPVTGRSVIVNVAVRVVVSPPSSTTMVVMV